jgi:excisionase family DNA binding protein
MEVKAYTSQGVLETALSDLVRQAVRAEVQDIMRSIRDEDRLLTIEEVAERLSVSKDWVYRNGRRLSFTRKLGPKLIRFSETGLQKWLKEQGRLAGFAHLKINPIETAGPTSA